MKKKRRSWKEFSSKCVEANVCECGLSLLCYHEDNIEGDCKKEDCPIWHKKR